MNRIFEESLSCGSFFSRDLNLCNLCNLWIDIPGEGICRSTLADFDLLVDKVIKLGRELAAE